MKSFTHSQQEIQRPRSGDCGDQVVPFRQGERRLDGSTHYDEPLPAPSFKQQADQECEWKQGKPSPPALDSQLLAQQLTGSCL